MGSCKLKFITISIIVVYTLACIISQLAVPHGLQGDIGSDGNDNDHSITSQIKEGHGLGNIFKIQQEVADDRKNIAHQNNHRIAELFKIKNEKYRKDTLEHVVLGSVEGNLWKKKVGGRDVLPVPYKEKVSPKTMSGRSKTHTGTKQEKYVVPNVVHYISFGKEKKWTFNQMLSVKSAFTKIKPEVIYFHCENEPTGSWWIYVKENIKTLKVVNVKAPETIFNQSIIVPSHKADVYRLKILQKYGGIYLNSNIIVLKSFDQFRRYNFTLGIMSKQFKQTPGKLNKDVIISAINATFINLWYNTYRTYKSKERPLDYHSCIIPYRLGVKFPALIHIEEHALIFPSNNAHLFVYQRYYDIQHKYAIQLTFNPTLQTFDPLTMMSSNTTFGYLLRLIYYENKMHL